MNDPQPEGHMASYIGRRKFLATLGGVVAWPRAARAQQGERMRRIGVLLNTAADDMVFQTRVGAFLQGIAIARRSLAAGAPACHAMCAGCGWLKRLANAPRHPEPSRDCVWSNPLRFSATVSS